MLGIPPDCDRLAEKLALLHLRLFPRPFSSHATECSGIVGEGTMQHMSLQKCANFSDCRPISACATDTRIQPEYPVLFSIFSGEFCLRLKPNLLVKIATDVLTEHCCQVCVLAIMFCRSDCRLCASMCGKWLRNHETPRTSVPRVLACWHSDRPTWDMKNILYIWFSHFTLTETHRC